MANTTNINVRVDEDLKRQAESIFTELGLNLSTAMNLFLRCAVRYGGIPFDLKISQQTLDLKGMSKAELDVRLEEGLASMRAGKGRPVYEVFDELEKELGLGRI